MRAPIIVVGFILRVLLAALTLRVFLAAFTISASSGTAFYHAQFGGPRRVLLSGELLIRLTFFSRQSAPGFACVVRPFTKSFRLRRALPFASWCVLRRLVHIPPCDATKLATYREERNSDSFLCWDVRLEELVVAPFVDALSDHFASAPAQPDHAVTHPGESSKPFIVVLLVFIYVGPKWSFSASLIKPRTMSVIRFPVHPVQLCLRKHKILHQLRHSLLATFRSLPTTARTGSLPFFGLRPGFDLWDSQTLFHDGQFVFPPFLPARPKKLSIVMEAYCRCFPYRETDSGAACIVAQVARTRIPVVDGDVDTEVRQ